MKENYSANRINTADGGLAYTLSAFLPYATALLVSLFFMGANNAQSVGLRFALLAAGQAAYIGLAVWFAVKKKNVEVLGVKKFSLKFLPIAVGLSFGMLFGLGYLNNLFVDLLTKLGLSYNPVSVPIATPLEFALSLLLVGILPGITEEIIFRGIILNSLSGFAAFAKVLLCGALFALLHQNPAQTVYPFITGCTFALIALKSRSVLPSVIMHVINNVTVLCLTFFAPTLNVYTPWVIALGCVCFAACFALLFLFRSEEKPRDAGKPSKFFIYAAPGIAMCAILWIVNLF